MTSDTENSSALSDPAPAQDVVSRLPKGWVPEGTGVWVVAGWEDEAQHWETFVPEFSIAGMGETVNDAIANAIELMDDYLAMCAADGLSYDEAYRPVSRFWRLRIAREAALSAIARRRRVRHRPEHSYLRLPVAANPRHPVAAQ